MALPESGPISLTDIQDEFGGSGTVSLSEYYKGGAYVLNTDYAPNVPTSGPISLSDFYGSFRTTLTTQTFSTVGDNIFVVPPTVVGNLIVTMTGGGGGGGGSDSQSGAPGYGGRTVTNSQIPVAPGDIINCFVGGGGGPGGSGGGGGGGGGKIICTKLYELGLLSEHIYKADQAFGAQLLESRPDIYHGYRAWANIVVDWMDGRGPKIMPWLSNDQFSEKIKQWSISWAQDIATPWAEHMAYKTGQLPQDNPTGRMITAIGVPVCKAIAIWQRVFGPSKKPAGFVKGALLVAVFVVFKLIANLGKSIKGK